MGSFPLGDEVILIGMTDKVGPKGQVHIPKAMRDALGIGPGDRVDFLIDGMEITIEPVDASRSLMGRLAGQGLTKALEADRRRECTRDDAGRLPAKA